MVGQAKLVEELSRYNIATLPKTMLFLGEDGCGKHTVVKWLAEKLGLETIEIDSNIDSELIVEYQQCPIKKMYIIDLAKFNEKQQNQFLKFIEEPSKNVYISLLANSELNILNTILGRCIIYRFLPYTKEELKSIRNVDNDIIYSLCKTPGQLINFDDKTAADLLALCDTIVKKIANAPYANTLSISTKINYKENYDKFDINVFFNALEFSALLDYMKTNNENSYNIYSLTNKYKQRVSKKVFNNETLILNFLSMLWENSKRAS